MSARIENLQSACALPIFIAGPMRSGTTLLRWLVDSHPNIVCVSEQNFLMPFVAAFKDEFLEPDAGEAFDTTKLFALSKNQSMDASPKVLCHRFRQFHESIYVDLMMRFKKTRWADATHHVTDHQIAVVDLIYEHQPQYLILVRHGMDCALSAIEKFKEISIERYLRYWAAVVDLNLAFFERHASRCLQLRYEDLVADPQFNADAIFDFLGESRISNVQEAVFGRPHGPSFGDHKILGTRAFHRSSVGRWKKVSLDVYRRAVRACPEFNENMMRCGYEPLDV